MTALHTFIRTLFVGSFRVAGLLTGILLLIFPAYKGVWLGYLPLALGGIIAWGLWRLHTQCERQLARVPEQYAGLAIFLLAALIQGVLISAIPSAPTSDALFVYQQAVAWSETGRMDPITYYAPAQIWYYGILFRLFGPSPALAQWAQVPFAALIPLLIYAISRQHLPTPRARLAAIASVLYPSLSLYLLVTPYYFYLYTLLILGMVWCWHRLAAAPAHWRYACAGGLLAGWGALTKATLLVAPVQLLFFLWITGKGTLDRQSLRHWLFFLVVMCTVLAPWVWRNQQVFDAPVMICTSGPLVFYSANNPESDGLYSDIPDRADIDTPQHMLAHMAWCNQMARDFIREQPGRFLELVWLKWLHTWGTETTFVELINYRGTALGQADPLLRFIVQTGWATVVLLWVSAACRSLKQRQPATMLELTAAIFVLSKFLIYALYEGGARHHLPAVPLLILYLAAATNRKSPTL
jgi:hypothetical protein